MFKPSSFPCQAWYVTQSFNIREYTLVSDIYGGRYFKTAEGYNRYPIDLFPSYDAAVKSIEIRLEEMRQRYQEAGYRIHEVERRLRKLKEKARQEKGGSE